MNRQFSVTLFRKVSQEGNFEHKTQFDGVAMRFLLKNLRNFDYLKPILTDFIITNEISKLF